MDVLVLIVAVMVLIMQIGRRPPDHARALLLSLLAQDVAARVLNDMPRASWLEHHRAVVLALKVHPSIPTRKEPILNRVATGALVRLGRMSHWHDVATAARAARG